MATTFTNGSGLREAVSLRQQTRTRLEGARARHGDVGAAMVLAAPFFPDRVFCGSEAETCSGASKAYILSGAAAVGIGIFGRVKARRAAGRLETLDETPRASHGIGVAPLPDGVAANYTVAW